MARVSIVRVLTSLERHATNGLAAVLRAVVQILTRLTGRGRYRGWRRQAEEEKRRRRQGLRR
jgi:hypothetical protein